MSERNVLMLSSGEGTIWVPELVYLLGRDGSLFNKVGDAELKLQEIYNKLIEDGEELPPEVTAKDLDFWLNKEYTVTQEWKNWALAWTRNYTEFLFGKAKPAKKKAPRWTELTVKVALDDTVFEKNIASLKLPFFLFALGISIKLTWEALIVYQKSVFPAATLIPHIFIVFFTHYTKNEDNNRKFFEFFNHLKKNISSTYKDKRENVEWLDWFISIALVVALAIYCAIETKKYLSGGLVITGSSILSVANSAYWVIYWPIMIITNIYNLFSKSGHFRILPKEILRWVSPDVLDKEALAREKIIFDKKFKKNLKEFERESVQNQPSLTRTTSSTSLFNFNTQTFPSPPPKSRSSATTPTISLNTPVLPGDAVLGHTNAGMPIFSLGIGYNTPGQIVKGGASMFPQTSVPRSDPEETKEQQLFPSPVKLTTRAS